MAWPRTSARSGRCAGSSSSASATVGGSLGQLRRPAARRRAPGPTRPARVRTPVTRSPGTSAASAAFAAGTTAAVDPGPRRRRDRGQHAAHRPDPAVQPELAEQHRVVEHVRRHHLLRGQDRRRDRQVEARAALGQAGRRQVDRDPLGRRPVLAAVHHRRAHPVARLRQRRVRQPDQAVRRHADAEVGLDLDQVPVDADQRHAAGPGQRHSGHPPHVLDPGRAARRPQHADQVDPDLRRVHPALVRSRPRPAGAAAPPCAR